MYVGVYLLLPMLIDGGALPKTDSPADAATEAEYTPPPSISYKAAAPADSYLNDPSPGYRASGSVTPLGDSTGRKEYEVIDQAHYAPNEIYKSGDHDDCHYVDKLVYKDQCIPYVEKTCYTQQEEICEDVFEKNCTAVIDDTDERECFEVTELICQLSESIDYNIVQETYTVLRCTRTSERVCDTVYDLAVSTKDDFQCIDVNYNYCWDEQKVVKDRTCTFSVDFECGKPQNKDGKDSVYCDKVPTKKCYDTPRVIREESCKPRVSKYCEKFTNEYPVPVEKQNCHSEPVKHCEMEERKRPKKAREFVYHKECRPVKRQVCEDCEKKKLRENCGEMQRNVCRYQPKEHCVEEEKKYCFQNESVLHEKVCLSERKVIVDETFSHV